MCIHAATSTVFHVAYALLLFLVNPPACLILTLGFVCVCVTGMIYDDTDAYGQHQADARFLVSLAGDSHRCSLPVEIILKFSVAFINFYFLFYFVLSFSP